MKRALIKLLLFPVVAIQGYAYELQKDWPEVPEIEQRFIDNPCDTHHQIEVFTLKPRGTGPFPVVFLLHGHQPPDHSTGGKQLIELGYLHPFVREGVIAVAISIPGFGHSDGDRDFSGPNSQKVVAAVVDHFMQFPFVDPQKMGIYGISKGATLASMVHKYTPTLLLQILEAGWYDLTTCSSLMPDYLEKIKENIVIETGGSKDSLIERSAIYNTQHIHCKTLILLGEFDDRRTLPSSVALHDKLISEEKDSQLIIYPNELHCLSEDKWSAVISFVRKQFFGLYGIGINLSLIMPAIHVAKIHPNSPAALSKALHVGDVILRISPNNDEEEIDVLRMPIPQVAALILGKKGTAVRLHVQHFDKTHEDIVIERG